MTRCNVGWPIAAGIAAILIANGAIAADTTDFEIKTIDSITLHDAARN